MKKLLLGGAAALLVGVSAYAMDDDRDHTRIHVANGSSIQVGDGQGTIVEIRGMDGDRTVHMSSSGHESVLEINGQEIVIDGGNVTIDGETVAAGHGAFVVINGDDVEVINGDHFADFDARHFAHMAERAEHMARMSEDLAHRTMIEIDIDGLEEEIMDTLAEAFDGLPENLEDAEFHSRSVYRFDNGRRWDDLSEEEQAEVREALEEAREEIREAMADVRVEMRNAAREVREARRVEIHVERDMDRAERDMERAARDLERAARDMERSERDRQRHHRRMEWRHNEHRDSDVENVRIEMDDDGRRRIWVNGEEQTGDDMTEWLNRLETDRLEGDD